MRRRSRSFSTSCCAPEAAAVEKDERLEGASAQQVAQAGIGEVLAAERLQGFNPQAVAKVFAANAKRLRFEHGLNRFQVGALLGCDHTWVYALETARGNPSAAMQGRIAAMYGVSIGDLYDAHAACKPLSRKRAGSRRRTHKATAQ